MPRRNRQAKAREGLAPSHLAPLHLSAALPAQSELRSELTHDAGIDAAAACGVVCLLDGCADLAAVHPQRFEPRGAVERGVRVDAQRARLEHAEPGAVAVASARGQPLT